MRITFYELSTYNSGTLLPFSIELNCVDTEEEYRDAITEKLSDLANRYKQEFPDSTFEEIIVADTDDVPESLVGEYDLLPEFWEYKEALEHHDEEIVDAARRLGIPYDKISEAYIGVYGSDHSTEDEVAADYAHTREEENGSLEKVPLHLRHLIDWKHYGHEVQINEISVCGRHVFRKDW